MNPMCDVCGGVCIVCPKCNSNFICPACEECFCKDDVEVEFRDSFGGHVRLLLSKEAKEELDKLREKYEF